DLSLAWHRHSYLLHFISGQQLSAAGNAHLAGPSGLLWQPLATRQLLQYLCSATAAPLMDRAIEQSRLRLLLQAVVQPLLHRDGTLFVAHADSACSQRAAIVDSFVALVLSFAPGFTAPVLARVVELLSRLRRSSSSSSSS